MVESVEPGSLAEVRALAGHLEVQPLLGRVVVRSALGEAEGVLLVVSLDKVFDDGAGFPQAQAGVGVFNGGNTAVGVELFERLLLHLGELKEFSLIGEVEFLEDDGHLPRVGTGCMAVEDDRLERHFQLAIAQGQVGSGRVRSGQVTWYTEYSVVGGSEYGVVYRAMRGNDVFIYLDPPKTKQSTPN